MSSKVSNLKQSLSFKSLRLLEWKESQSSSIRSFSDPETSDRSICSRNKEVPTVKSKSESNLSIFTTKDKKVDGNKDILKAFYIPDATISRSNKEDENINFKNINDGFNINSAQDTPQESEAQLKDNDCNSEKLFHQNKSSSVSSENDISIPANGKCGENTSNSNILGTIGQQTLNPYPILESSSKSELIIGEPRCLALKKNDVNPFLTDDPLIFEPDSDDDHKSFFKAPKKDEQSLGKFLDDMFIDEDEISASKKKRLLMDREDGELTPEAPHKPPDSNKVKDPSSSEKKATFDFFNKINECLRELNDKCREFYSSSTPDYSLTHLQRTLGNVDNIKRKLAFLVKSKNTEKEEKNNGKKSTHKSHSNMRLYSERSTKSSSSMKDNNQYQDKQEQSSGLKSDIEELYRQLKENRDKRNSEHFSRHGHRREKSNRDKPSQADLLNRKKVSMLEKLGTKQEIERVQSLFKRQMNLITQHVIQKNELDKRYATKQKENQRRKRRGYSSPSREEESSKSHDKVDLKDLKTLEDMEAFLDSLKKDKTLCEQYMTDQKSRNMLKFSSKKEKRILSEPANETPVSESVKITKDSKESFKEPLSKKSFTELKSEKIQEANLKKLNAKQKADEMEINNTKTKSNIVSVSESFSNQENSEHPKKRDTKDSNHDAHLKNELSKRTNQIDSGSLMSEAPENGKARCDQGTKLKNSEFNKCEIELNKCVELQNQPPKFLHTSEKGKQEEFKRKREDLSDNKFENENEGKGSKKQKTIKYLAARRLSTESPSRNNNNSHDENTSVGTAESLVKDLLSKKVVILDDKGAALNNEFCIKVINNEVFLKKVSNKRKRKRDGRALKSHPSKTAKRNRKDLAAVEEKFLEVEPNLDQKQIELKLPQETNEPEIDPETIDDTLNEMENFLQDLRLKKKVRDDENHHPLENNSHNRELKFLARVQAKRKAKLMACVSDGVYSIEKEAKFLKALEKKNEDIPEASDIENRKQAFLEKIRAEKEAIAEKPIAKQNDDDPLKDVKAFLNMIKEAESGNNENAKQVYVSFSLKRSDVKKLENLTTGKTSLLTEESQKFLNSVRSKMKAKKTPMSGISALMRKPEI